MTYLCYLADANFILLSFAWAHPITLIQGPNILGTSMQYWSLQHRILSSLDTSTNEHHFCFYSRHFILSGVVSNCPLFFSRRHWAPSTWKVHLCFIYFCLYIVAYGVYRVVYRSGFWSFCPLNRMVASPLWPILLGWP